jgi:hypothetical protein
MLRRSSPFVVEYRLMPPEELLVPAIVRIEEEVAVPTLIAPANVLVAVEVD